MEQMGDIVKDHELVRLASVIVSEGLLGRLAQEF